MGRVESVSKNISFIFLSNTIMIYNSISIYQQELTLATICKSEMNEQKVREEELVVKVSNHDNKNERREK